MSVSVQSPCSAHSPSPSSPSSTASTSASHLASMAQASTDSPKLTSSRRGSFPSKISLPPQGTTFPANFAMSDHATRHNSSSGYLSPHSQSHTTQDTAEFLDRLRSQSLFVPSGVSPLSTSSPLVSPSLSHLAKQRRSLPASSFANNRKAQLALLADQAKMAATGTSSLRIARANSIVVDEALRRIADQAGSGITPPRGDEDIGQMAVDPAWEAAFCSPGFLASASSLAHLFQAQEQSRKEWAGQALALQHRRWTMTPATGSTPIFGHKKRVSPASEVVDPLDSMSKRRRVSFDQRHLSSKSRKVSFAQTWVPPTATSGSRSPPPSASSAGTGISPFSTASSSRSPPPELKSAMAPSSRRRSSLSSHPESRPQLLANVIASFATLLDTRQQACATLAELAMTGDALLSAQSPPSVSRTSSPPVAGSSSFQGAGEMCAIAESDSEVDSEAMYATSSSDGSDIKELSRSESAMTIKSAQQPAQSAASDGEEVREIARSSGEDSAMRLVQALADVKDEVPMGNRTGDEQMTAASPAHSAVSTTA